MTSRSRALLALAVAVLTVACADPMAPPPPPDVPALDVPDSFVALDMSVGVDTSDLADFVDAREAAARCDIGGTFCGTGCVDVRNDNTHCGRCDNTCSATDECLAGTCVVRCTATETRCDGRCVTTRTDRAHCSACGRACPSGEVCSDGVCRPDCDAALTVCAPMGAPRYCADTRTDRMNCGACGMACSSTNLCLDGRCVPICTMTQTRCGDTCHDLRSDRAHCGTCNRACSGDEQCLAGRCRVPCAAGTADCNETCVTLATDVNHCGACNARCRVANTASVRCVAGHCAIGACTPGRSDCDGLVANGCEVNTDDDPSHCGACGNACAFVGARARCVAGRCVMGDCAPGYADCDANPSNGCEANLLSSFAHCGACSTTAAPRACRSGQVCANGTCATACPLGRIQCSGDCVVLAREPRHCGACARPCALPNTTTHVCVAGACQATTCAAGFGDCDANPANGCEQSLLGTVTHCGACARACRFANAAATCVMGTCRMGACTTGFGDCDGDASNGCEVNLALSREHCGACSTIATPRACAAGEVCAEGRCLSECIGTSLRCGASCVDTSTDTAHCGACNRVCRLPGVAVATCTRGVCGVERCMFGAGNCNAVAADGCEVDLRANADHCGACGRVCRFANAVATCDEGVCRRGACLEGWGDCNGDPGDGCETNVAVDPSNCGGCSGVGAALRTCATGQFCALGRCVAACDRGTVACAGLCLDVSSDASNCGACGAVCNLANAVSMCVDRACRIRQCRAGFADCDGNPANGCEVNLMGTDRTHCGRCGFTCTLPNAAGACMAGVCVAGTCAAGFGDCDGVAANGCETRLTVDGEHCGACGRRCATGQVCVNGACGTVCAMGATACGTSCRDTATDPRACGACGVECLGADNAHARCLGATCGITCAAVWGNCDGVPSNGCERRLDTASDCGACGRACVLPRARSLCTPSGACVVVACDAGYADCDRNAANGCEVNLGTDAARCGACTGRACATGQLCQGGACVTTCGPGRIRCGNGCVDPRTDALHCGSCGVECASFSSARGVCRPIADFDAGVDGSVIGSGECTIECVAGTADCDDDVLNGCETALTTSSDCGACGRRCDGATQCIDGRCQVPTGYRAVVASPTPPFLDACTAPGATRVMFARREGAVAAVVLPFAFPFWGSPLPSGTLLTASTAGYLAMGTTLESAASGILPSTSAPNGMLAPHWGDLVARDPQLCVATLGTSPNRNFVVEWPDAGDFEDATESHLTFEVVLRERTGAIDFIYASMRNARARTTGVESPDGRRGVRPPASLFATCDDALGNHCTPSAGTVYHFIPTL